MKSMIEEQANTKEQILFSAKVEFAEKGYDGARMGAIAKRAKVNQALIHYYFRSKENLFTEILHRLFGVELSVKIKEKTDRLMEEYKMNPPEKLYVGMYLLIISHFKAFDEDCKKILSREITEEREQIKALIKDYLIPRVESFESIISEGIESGDFSTINPLYIVVMPNSFIQAHVHNKQLIEGTKFYHRLYGENSEEQVMDFLLELMFKALRPENKELKIPELAPEIIYELDNFIEIIKKENEWNVNIS